jgi:hypothetical protein
MKHCLIITAFLLFACDKKRKIVKSTQDIQISADIPQKVMNYIQSRQPDWMLPERSDYHIWWSFYDRDEIPYFATADINDDEKADYAIIVKQDGILQTHFLISTGKTYSHWTDESLKLKTSSSKTVTEYGLQIIEPRQLDYIFKGKDQTVILLRNAVGLMEVENLKKIYYWSEGKLTTLQVKL